MNEEAEKPVIVRFMDWVRQRCEAVATAHGLKVYDERERSLAWLIESGLAELEAPTVVVSLPATGPVKEGDCGAQDYTVEGLVAMRYKPTAKDGAGDAFAAVLALFGAFDAAVFEMPAGFPPNVQPTRLTHDLRRDESLHSFTVRTTISFN